MSTQPPRDWMAIVAAVEAAAPADALAVHARAARDVASHLALGTLAAGVAPLRVAVLRSFTAEVLSPAIIASLAVRGFASQLELGQLGNIAPEILTPDSFVYSDRHQLCVVLTLAEHVLPDLADPGAAEARAAAARDYLSRIDHLAARFTGTVIAANLAHPPRLVAGNLQAQRPAGGRYAVDEFNRGLAEIADRRANLSVLDLAALAADMGGEAFWSPRDFLTSMQPFSARAIPRIAAALADLIWHSRSTPVKCIVLDCDNTLWGGVIGEDGLGGIRLGETYPGICYQEFQRQLRDLNRMGFLLALNSKNNEDEVRRVFDEHPGMILRLDNIAAERVNWQDKVANLQELAEELNIGLDSFVFIDDSDFEINLVRERLPQVRSFQVPAQPWKLPALLPSIRAIDKLAITAEDRKKATMYLQERARKSFKAQAGDMEAYLRGLDIRMLFEPFDPAQHLARAAQLTQKTNQFNLTTRRFSEAEITRIIANGGHVFTASLSDRFGDYGRVILAMLLPAEDGTTIRLHTFLMSCRVIGRGIEGSFLRLVLGRMRDLGFRRCEAEFLPTPKNAVSAGFLAAAGFTETGRDADGRIAYHLPLDAEPAAADPWITVKQV
ncbi:MAG: hypothetical protein AMXMBFR47_33790 [Planctomycetota bacterium]